VTPCSWNTAARSCDPATSRGGQARGEAPDPVSELGQGPVEGAGVAQAFSAHSLRFSRQVSRPMILLRTVTQPRDRRCR
jgi:hypothetical protein